MGKRCLGELVKVDRSIPVAVLGSPIYYYMLKENYDFGRPLYHDGPSNPRLRANTCFLGKKFVKPTKQEKGGTGNNTEVSTLGGSRAVEDLKIIDGASLC